MSKKTLKITEDTIKNEPSQYEVVMTPDAIPDLGKLSEIILELLEFLETEKMIELENKYMNEFAAANILEDQLVEQEKILAKTNQESAEYDKIEKNLLEIKRKITKLRKSADTKKGSFESVVYGKYNNLLPMKIIALMLEQERYSNLNDLLDMFETLKDVKLGKKDINIEAEKFGEKNRSKFVYPKFGGKDNFYETMNGSKK